MSFTLPNFDPYKVLGVAKDASLAEIKSAHRKLVLRCHPDKVKDESQQARAQEEFQQVQESYEMLSDENRKIRYDQEIKLTELRKEAKERSLGRGSSSSAFREYRDGRVYEERTPSFADEADQALSDEPRSFSRKYDDFGKRPRSKGMDEKKKSKSVPIMKAATYHDSPKASRHNRAKVRTKERRRQSSAKYESYFESDDESFSSDSSYRHSVHQTSEGKRSRESLPRKTRGEPSRSPEFRRHKDEHFSDFEKEAYQEKEMSAQEHIRRTKASPHIGVDRRTTRMTRSPERYDESSDGGRGTTRHPRRSHKMDSSRPVSPPKIYRSYEHLDAQPRSYDRSDRPSLHSSTSASSGIKMPRAVPLQTRSPTGGSHSKSSRRDAPSRSNSGILGGFVSGLSNLVDPSPSKPKVRSSDKYDSGYSSPGTPEMQQTCSSTKSSTKYVIVEPGPEMLEIKPELPRRRESFSSDRPPMPSRAGLKPPTRSSTTYSYGYENPRPSNSRSSTSRALFGEVLESRHKESEARYREIRPERSEHIPIHRDAYSRSFDDRYRHLGRRQTAQA